MLRVPRREATVAAVLIDVAEIPLLPRLDQLTAAPAMHDPFAHLRSPTLALLLVDRAVNVLPIPVVVPNSSKSGGEMIERAVPVGVSHIQNGPLPPALARLARRSRSSREPERAPGGRAGQTPRLGALTCWQHPGSGGGTCRHAAFGALGVPVRGGRGARGRCGRRVCRRA